MNFTRLIVLQDPGAEKTEKLRDTIGKKVLRWIISRNEDHLAASRTHHTPTQYDELQHLLHLQRPCITEEITKWRLA